MNFGFCLFEKTKILRLEMSQIGIGEPKIGTQGVSCWKTQEIGFLESELSKIENWAIENSKMQFI